MYFTHKIEKKGNVQIIRLSGEIIDRNQTFEMMDAINELVAKNHIHFVIDLENLKYLNSSGLTVLIQTLTKARKAGGEAVISNVSKRVNELLVITKLNTVFTVADSVEDAIAKLDKLVSN